MSPDNSTTSAGVAKAPFNNVENSDTIFRTSDGVDFHVHRVVLVLASPFFRDMFSLPQSPSDSNKPVIGVTESSKILDPLFRLCYPVHDPSFPDSDLDTLSLIGDVLEAALKYEIAVAVDIMKGLLRKVGKNHHLHGYAIACRLQLEDEAFLAAKRWRDSRPKLVANGDGKIVAKGQFMNWKKTIAGASYSKEMVNISAGAYYRLIQYVRTGITTKFCAPSTTRSNRASRGSANASPVSEHFDFPDSDIRKTSNR